jgi:Aromatic prenyltransferase Orf2
MPEAAVAEDMYSAIEESARLVGSPCSREKIWPILTAYADALPEAGMVVSVSTGGHPPKELDYTITMPMALGDPYAVAQSNGFVSAAGHPAATLLSDIHARVSVTEHLIDAGVDSGFSKIYAHFPFDLLGVQKLADVPAMPRSVAENAGLFLRHYLNDVAMIGIDYRRKTVNLYFAQLPDEFRDARNILSLHRELGLPKPNEKWLEFAKKSFRVYATLSWDSPKIERICFARKPFRGWDPSAFPIRIDPEIEKFVLGSRRTYGGQPVVISAVKWTPDGEYLNLGPYCRLSPLMRNLLQKLVGEKL